MAIKVTIQNLINSLIRSNPSLIDKTEHADVEDALLLNSYGNIINETRTTTSHTSRITTPNGVKTNITYNIFIVKQGRLVTIKGIVFNNTDSIISENETNDFIFEIVDYEYLPSAAIQAIGGVPTLCATTSGDTVKMYFYNDKLIVDSLGAGGIVYLNIEYLTEN